MLHAIVCGSAPSRKCSKGWWLWSGGGSWGCTNVHRTRPLLPAPVNRVNVFCMDFSGVQADEFNFSSAPLFLFGAARMQLQPSGVCRWNFVVCRRLRMSPWCVNLAHWRRSGPATVAGAARLLRWMCDNALPRHMLTALPLCLPLLATSETLLKLLLSKSQEFGATLRTGDVAVRMSTAAAAAAAAAVAAAAAAAAAPAEATTAAPAAAAVADTPDCMGCCFSRKAWLQQQSCFSLRAA